MTDTADPSPEPDEDPTDERVDAHLEDVEEGAGCTEIWEHLAEHRDE